MIFGGLSTIEFINVVRIKDDDYFQKIMEFKKSEIPKDAVSTTEIDSIAKFLAHIDWSEPWLQGLVAFHIISFFVVILTRKRVNFQGTLFVILLISIGLTEKTNEYMASNYKQYFKQQYFDSHGMFISFVYSAPVLVNCVIILINWFNYSTQLLVSVKQRELKDRIKDSNEKKVK